jgi:two-component system CheB/CheR fusion protein
MKGAKQILVVEDHEDTRNVLERLCSRCGLVFTAATLHGALQLVQTTPFDVIISDIALPDGTGYALISEVRRRGINALSIALSAYSFPDDVQEAKLTGFDYHMRKPFDYLQLQSLLEQRAIATAERNV